MTTRQATVEDAAVMSAIHAESWRAAYVGMVPQQYLDELKDDFWAISFAQWLATGAAKSVLAYAGDTPAACAVYGKSRDESLPHWAEIITVYVRPQFFGRGCGKMLLNAVLEALRADGYKNAYLWVLEQNKKAAGFYTHMGFTPTSDVLECEILGKPLTDYRYTIALGGNIKNLSVKYLHPSI